MDCKAADAKVFEQIMAATSDGDTDEDNDAAEGSFIYFAANKNEILGAALKKPKLKRAFINYVMRMYDVLSEDHIQITQSGTKANLQDEYKIWLPRTKTYKTVGYIHRRIAGNFDLMIEASERRQLIYEDRVSAIRKLTKAGLEIGCKVRLTNVYLERMPLGTSAQLRLSGLTYIISGIEDNNDFVGLISISATLDLSERVSNTYVPVPITGIERFVEKFNGS